MTKQIAIIGGGVVGATAAYYLSKEPQYKVTLFDEGVGQGTSASAGIISPWLSKRRNKEWYNLVKLGAAFYPDFLTDVLAGKEIPKNVYQQVGTLLFTKKDKALEELLAIGEKRRVDAPEIGDLKILNPEDIQKLIPIYTKEKRALFASGGARVDGQELVQLLTTTAMQQGTTYISQKATLKPKEQDQWIVETKDSRAAFDEVILANAAWLAATLEPFGYEVDVRPQKGQLVELETPWMTDAWPVIMPAGEKDIIPFLDGKIVIGATHEDEAGFDLILEEKTLGEMVENAQAQFSEHLDKDWITRGRVGTRAYTSDFAPFFGPVPGMANVYTASGLGSTGLTAGPIVGKILSDFILGKEPALDPAAYPIENYLKKGEED